jgi:hypothetical protein
MKDDSGRRGDQGRASAKNARLKLALRENLKRRKSQARGRSDINAVPSGDPDVSLDDETSKPGE